MDGEIRRIPMSLQGLMFVTLFLLSCMVLDRPILHVPKNVSLECVETDGVLYIRKSDIRAMQSFTYSAKGEGHIAYGCILHTGTIDYRVPENCEAFTK